MSDQLDNMQEYAQEVQETIAQPQEAAAPQENSREMNARILRERAEAAERRAAELEYRMNLHEQQQSQRQQPAAEEDDLLDISDDAYVEGHQVKKYLKRLDKRVQDATRSLREETQRNALKYAESSLKSQFSDFDQVVTQENLAKLSQAKAPLFRSIMSNQDIYDRGYSAYEAIKAMSGNTSQYADVDRKIQENRQRPQSASNAPSHLGETPLTRVHDYDRRVLSPERKAQILKNLEEAKRNR